MTVLCTVCAPPSLVGLKFLRSGAVHVGFVDPRLLANMTSFQEVMTQAGTLIMNMSGHFIKIPNMQNGRCLPSAKALSEATLEQVKSQRLARRNAIGVPIMESGTIDHARYDLEMEVAEEAAQTHQDGTWMERVC